MLQDALVSLILEKGYDAITVQDICDRGNVGRATFYAHYTGKDDLKRSGLEHLRRELVDHPSEAAGGPAFSLGMFRHARDHLDLYRALIGTRGGTLALGTIRDIVAELVRADLAAAAQNAERKRPAAEPIPRELVVQYVVGAFMALLTGWLDDGAKLPPEEIDAVFRRLTTGAIKAQEPVDQVSPAMPRPGSTGGRTGRCPERGGR